MGLFGPSFMKVWQQGSPSPGTLVGIRRFTVSDDESTIELEEYAVDVGGELVGIRQKLEPRDEVRLGMPVTVHRDGKAAVIRFGAPIERRWKAVKPPAAGIQDKVDAPGGGWSRGEAEILELGTRSAVLGLTTVAQARVRFEGPVPVEAFVDKFYPAFYASHLGKVGDRLPAVQHPRDPQKVRIDWPAAAIAHPGIGVAPLAAPVSATSEAGSTVSAGGGITLPSFGSKGLLDRAQDKMQAMTAGAMGFDPAPPPAADDPVPWETFLAATVAIRNEPGTPPDEVAQRHGVPAGEWDATNKRWMGRIMTDWKLGAAYGQALS